MTMLRPELSNAAWLGKAVVSAAIGGATMRMG
jgi:hypothetical protein